MSPKYRPLADHLRASAAEGRNLVELTFTTVDRLVGGLPPSALTLRTWWANGSNPQARAWREAGWRVQTVDLAQRRAVFVSGQAARNVAVVHRAAAPETPTSGPNSTLASAPEQSEVDVAIRFSWRDAGRVVLDGQSKPMFPALPAVAGLYRLTLSGGLVAVRRPRIYIGETDGLRRRLAGNYRSPGPSQATSLRVNALLRQHLGLGGVVDLAIATEAWCLVNDGERAALDLTRKAARMLAENAALVLAQVRDDADIENLG